nr:DUF397 domain-containing protein [Nocardia yamanashiensis]
MPIDLRGARWFKSSHSSAGQDCVEVAFLSDGAVGVRDSKNPIGPVHIFAASEWDVLIAAVEHGVFRP